MRRPTQVQSDPDLEHLIAICLELHEGSGPSAVDALLRNHPDSSIFVRERLDLLGRMGLIGEAPKEAMPERIGDFEILGVLGRGGMGVVYEAKQDQLGRRVALKVLRSLPNKDGLQRFQHEAELLARLQHPGLAQVYEVGSALVGGMRMPYFAMELVRGQRIDEYVKEAKLGPRAILELIAKLADAVQHAHHMHVVHRDLKPANILVDERGEPRILDFGIAATIDPELKLDTLRTETGQLVGTLDYMSPEQAQGSARLIDSRADVYSLGVVAYELLSGRLPYSSSDQSVLEILRMIQEQDAPLLSLVDRRLAGDVETIVAKALEKDKGRRYASADALAADLRRHLNSEPIHARPATALYQLRKFSQRHRALVLGASAFVLALGLGLVGTLKGMLDAGQERNDAERRFRQANAVLDFQKRMFASADPDQAGIRMEDLLDRGTLLINETAGPLEEAAIRLTLGETYESIGLFEKARPLIEAAVLSFEAQLGPRDLQTLAAKTSLAALYGSRLGELELAEAALEDVDQLAAQEHGAAHAVTLRARLMRASLELDKDHKAEAVRIAREVLALTATEGPLRYSAKHLLARSLEQLGQKDEALLLAFELRDSNRSTLGEAHPDTWTSMNALGNMLRDMGRAQEGKQVLEELWELRKEHLGRMHPDTLNAQSNLGTSHVQLGLLDRAEELLLEVLAACEANYAPSHPERLRTMNSLASVHMLSGRVQSAEPLLREVVELCSSGFGRTHVKTTSAMANLGKALSYLGQPDEAEALFSEALDIRMGSLGAKHYQTLSTMFQYGTFLTRSARYEEADFLLQDVVAIGRELLDREDYTMSTFLRGFGRNLALLGRLEEAESALLESFEQGERTRPEHRENQDTLNYLADVYTRLKDPEAANRTRALMH